MTVFRAPIHLHQGVWAKLEDKSIPAFKNEKFSALFKPGAALLAWCDSGGGGWAGMGGKVEGSDDK